ncbi:DnaD and phage-associated domain-containing protein [Clostridium collagenovorans DSM 3089]|uniref:DnaD and phage-associated domain-containing protein n=1 Tax=Clostridium collagenovorans DSM 3089 TaxID=1121306 RepID=A0A1M5XAC8_9CLOT|nr:DnaD domain protein [Clostridium collagenovorans]SHH96508.1 DnaD and phage-associated domain-containing protein [Clostridium collagenovorans DSM 3089]
MSTFMFSSKNIKHTLISNVFIDRYMPTARGEYVKVYILGLKYFSTGEAGASSSVIAATLNLLETDVLHAWNYWSNEGVIKMEPIDSKGNYTIEFLDLSESEEVSDSDVHILKELDNLSTKDMLQDIEKLIGRPLSNKEISMYIGWQKEFGFSLELTLILIQYCASKGKTDYRYIEKVALAWHDNNIKTIDEAQDFISYNEDKWVKLRKILNYLGIQNKEIMKPQEQLLTKWISTYNFPLDVIFHGCDICFNRIGKTDFKYIDGILNSWFKDGLKTLEEIEKNQNSKKKTTFKPNTVGSKPKSSSNSNFGNYEQRSYDFDDLEKKLLGWDDND